MKWQELQAYVACFCRWRPKTGQATGAVWMMPKSRYDTVLEPTAPIWSRCVCLRGCKFRPGFEDEGIARCWEVDAFCCAALGYGGTALPPRPPKCIHRATIPDQRHQVESRPWFPFRLLRHCGSKSRTAVRLFVVRNSHVTAKHADWQDYETILILQ